MACRYPDLFYVCDDDVALESVLTQGLPPAPADTTFSVHWLAVHGVQPRIPPNPTPSSQADNVPNGDGEQTTVKSVVRHVLSKEQQMYYEQVTLGLRSGDAQLQRAVLLSVQRDAGLHQLVPYFVQFIADQVNSNLRDLLQLRAAMRLAHAMLSSPHMQIEPYLHQLMPPILTCLVGRHLCRLPTEDHWSLRDTSATLVAHICKQYGPLYQNLQPRITKTLAKALLDPKRPLTTHYGAIRGLEALGPNVMRVLVLPHVPLFYQLLEPELQNTKNPTKRLEAEYCTGALQHACGVLYRYHILESPSSEEISAADAEDGFETIGVLRDLFGEAMHPYMLNSDSQLATTFI